MSAPELTYVPFSSPADEIAPAVESIYAEAFRDDERVPFAKLVDLLAHPSDDARATLGAFTHDREVVAMGSALYYPEPDFGYLAYLAVRADLRGRRYGLQVVRALLDWSGRQAQEVHGRTPRLTFWEVRHPQAARDEAERLESERRVRFYQGLGARPLPITYTCPSIGPGLPDMTYLPMAYTYPPGRDLTRAEALDVAWHGVVRINGARPESDFWTQARGSVDKHWPQ